MFSLYYIVIFDQMYSTEPCNVSDIQNNMLKYQYLTEVVLYFKETL